MSDSDNYLFITQNTFRIVTLTRILEAVEWFDNSYEPETNSDLMSVPNPVYSDIFDCHSELIKTCESLETRKHHANVNSGAKFVGYLLYRISANVQQYWKIESQD